MKHPIAVGKLGSSHGVHGWLRVHSYTDPIENITHYQHWYTRVGQQWHALDIEGFKAHDRQILAKIKGIDSPEAAKLRVNEEIWVERDEFDDITDDDEYYWSDLIGCQVSTPDGIKLGIINELMETGSNDIFVVIDDEREGKRHLIPHINGIVLSIDIDNKKIVADWDPDF